jgi:excisionase family DNA binding protein
MNTPESKQTNLNFVNCQTIPVARAAKLLKRSRQTVRRMIEQGILDAYQVTENGWFEVSYASVVDYIAHLSTGGTARQYLEKKRALA